ncbi:MAG: hypothetical protein AB7U85_07755, partial [Alphaproteobacteria bacterium]
YPNKGYSQSCTTHWECGAEGSGMQCYDGSCVACPSTVVSGLHETDTVKASTCGTCPSYAPYYRGSSCVPCSNSTTYWTTTDNNTISPPSVLGCRGYCKSYSCQVRSYNDTSAHILTRCPVGYKPPSSWTTTLADCSEFCPTDEGSAKCGTCPPHKPYFRKKSEENSKGPLDQYFCTCCNMKDELTDGTCPEGGTCEDFIYNGPSCEDDYDCGSQNGYECVDNQCVECDTSWTLTTSASSIIDHTGEKTCGTCPPHAPFWRYDDHSHSGWDQFAGCVPCSAPKSTGTSSTYYAYYYPFNNSSLTQSDDDLPGCRGRCGYSGASIPGQYAGSQWSCSYGKVSSKIYRCPIGYQLPSTLPTSWTKCTELCSTGDGAANTCSTCPDNRPYYRVKSTGEYFCSSCHSENGSSDFCSECGTNYVCLTCGSNFESDGNGGCQCANHFACGAEGSGRECVSGKCVDCSSSNVAGLHELAAVKASVCGTCPSHKPYYRSAFGGCSACSNSANLIVITDNNSMPPSDVRGCRGYCYSWACKIKSYNDTSAHILMRCPVGFQPPATWTTTWTECSNLCPTEDNSAVCGTCPPHKPYYRKKATTKSTGPIDQYFCTCCQASSTKGSACPSGGSCINNEWVKNCENNYDCGAQSGYECVDGKCVDCDTSWTLTTTASSIIDHSAQKTCGTCPPHAPFWRYDDHSHSAWSNFAGCVPCSAPKSTGTSSTYYAYYYPFNNSSLTQSDDDLPGCRGRCGYSGASIPGQYSGSQWACSYGKVSSKNYRCPVGYQEPSTMPTSWTKCTTLCSTVDGEENTCNSCPATTPYYRVKSNGEYLCSSCHTPNTGSDYCGTCDANYVCTSCPENFVSDGKGGCKCSNHFACGNEGSGKQCVDGVCVDCPSANVAGYHETSAVKASTCGTCPSHSPFFRVNTLIAGGRGCVPCSTNSAGYWVYQARNALTQPENLGCRGYCYKYKCRRYAYNFNNYHNITRCPVGFVPPSPFSTTWTDCTALCQTEDDTGGCGTCPSYKPYYRKKATTKSTGPVDQYFCTCCRKSSSTDGSSCPEGGECTDYEWSKSCNDDYDCGAQSGYECVDKQCVECSTTWTLSNSRGGIIDHTGEKTCGTCPPHAPFWRYDDHAHIATQGSPVGTNWTQFSGCVPCSSPKSTGNISNDSTTYRYYYYPFDNVNYNQSSDDLPGCRGRCGWSGSSSLPGNYPGSIWACHQKRDGSKIYRCPVGIVDEMTTSWKKCGAICDTSDGADNTCNSCPSYAPYYRVTSKGKYLCAECHTPGEQNGCPTTGSTCNADYECKVLAEVPDLCTYDSDCGEGFKCTGDPKYCAVCSTSESCGTCNCGTSQKPDGTGKCVNNNNCCTGACNVATGKSSCAYSDLACSGIQQCQTSGINAGTCCNAYTPYWRNSACKPCTGTSGHTGTCNTPGMMCNSNYDCVSCTSSDAGCIECYTNADCPNIRQCSSGHICCPATNPYWNGSGCVECVEHRQCASNICQNYTCKTPETIECGTNQIWYNGTCQDCPSGSSKIGSICICSDNKIWNTYTNSCVTSVKRDGLSTSSGKTINMNELTSTEEDSDERYSRIKRKINRIRNSAYEGVAR